MYLYEIRSTKTDKVYVGITRKALSTRWNQHKSAFNRGLKTILYDCMRSHGIDSFTISVVAEFTEEDKLLAAEKAAVLGYKKLGLSLNILDGGESYFNIKDKDAWKAKLREKRKGRVPSLGMKHTEENKKYFSVCVKLRWDLYGRYPKEVLDYGFTEANKKFGISKTHYYRLRKSTSSNETS